MIGSNEKKVLKTIVFDGGAAKGLSGSPIPLFTVTGSVWCLIVGFCTETTAVSGAATIEVGITGATAALIPQTLASLIANGDIWFDTSPTSSEPQASIGGAFIGGGNDIFGTVGTANITDGTVTWACFWTPLSADGNVIAA